MSDFLEQFRASFFEEAVELVDSMEAILLRLDLAHLEPEDLHVLFRVAHSLKGNAATFGFQDISAFTHHLESTMEPVRQGTLPFTSELLDLLLQSVDLIRTLIAQGKADQPLGEADRATQDALIQRLKRVLEGGGLAAPATPQAAPPQAPAKGNPGFNIHFQAPADAFRRGINLERIFRDLKRLGPCTLWFDAKRLPALEDLDPETCFLAWDVRLEADVPRSAVEEVFEFVDDGNNIRIEQLELMSPEAPALGAILVDEGVVSPTALQQALDSQKHVGELLVEMGAAPPEQVEKALDQQQKKRSQAEASSIRVATDKVDKLVNLVGELVITQAMLAQSSQLMDTPAGQSRFNEALLQLDRQTRDLQERVMSIRMVPVDMVFSRFPRMVRELGRQLGKEVDLHLEGQSTELDKTFIEMLVDPLTHLVRNAVDHGLEEKDERRKLGKPTAGRISLKAQSRGGHIFIDVQDDGKGLDKERILAKGVERGLVGPEARLSEEDIFALIFEPGFSTAAVVSDVSGRGVGMDVVRQNIRALGGRIEVTSQPGLGSTFRLVLPLTLAILDGLTVRIGCETYVFPLASVVESFLPRQGEIQSMKGDREVINLRGAFIPVIRLHDILGVRPLEGDRARHERPLVVMVESDGRRAALVVDELIGQQQVVIKSLEAHYRRVDGLSGATILGDGRVALILDVPGILRMDVATLGSFYGV